MDKDFIILIIVMSLSAFAFAIFDVIFPLYLDSKQISLPQIGIIFAIPVLLGIATRVLAGIFSDIYGRKPFFQFALFGGSIATFLFTKATNAWEFLSINFFANISSSLSNATDHILIFEAAPRKKVADAIGKLKGISNTLKFLGAFIAGSLLLFLGYTNTLLFCSLIIFITFLIFFKFREKRPFGKLKYKSLSEFFDVRFLTKKMKFYTVSSFFLDMSNTMVLAFTIQLFLTRYFQVSPLILSIVLGLSTLFYALSSFFFGKLSDIFQPAKVCIYMYFLTALMTVFMGSIPNVTIISFLWIISGLTMGVTDPATRKMLNVYARPNFRGKDTNVARAIGSTGLFIGPLLAGYVGAYSFGLVFVFSGIFLAFAAMPLLFIKSK
jgi:MFS family permease